MSEFGKILDRFGGKGAGMNEYGMVNGEPVYFSRSIREVFMGNDAALQKLLEAVRCFQDGDYGDAALHQKRQNPGHEYGRYDITPLGRDAGEDSGVYMHRAENAILVYFAFER